jgi:hypothetical protein
MSPIDINSEEQRDRCQTEKPIKYSHTTGTILDTTPATVHTTDAANLHEIISRLHAQQK